jgi:hypothetical protein
MLDQAKQYIHDSWITRRFEDFFVKEEEKKAKKERK